MYTSTAQWKVAEIGTAPSRQRSPACLESRARAATCDSAESSRRAGVDLCRLADICDARNGPSEEGAKGATSKAVQLVVASSRAKRVGLAPFTRVSRFTSAHSLVFIMVQDHSSLFKPTKRPRQVTRRESQAPTFPLFQLPTELVSYILDLVTEAAELEALSWSCRTFYRACRKRALLARFSVVAPLQRNVHCFEGAQPGELGYKPFSIISCSRAENGTDVRMRAAEHNVTRFEREGQTLQHLLIQWTEAEVYLRHVCRYCLSNSSCHNQVTFSWNKQARGRLLKMNSAMMDSRFDCLECGSSRLVAYGSEEIEDRCALHLDFRSAGQAHNSRSQVGGSYGESLPTRRRSMSTLHRLLRRSMCDTLQSLPTLPQPSR